MPQQLIDTLILSMGRRCETCLAVRRSYPLTKDRMFLAGHPSQGCFGLQSHCAPCYFFNQASFYPSDFSFRNYRHLPPIPRSRAPSRSKAKTALSSALFLVYSALCGKPPSALCDKLPSALCVKPLHYAYRRLIERNLCSYRPLRNLSLTPEHCRAILQWFFTRSGWNHADWGRIVFSHESHFQLCPDNHRRRVWRRQGQRADPAFTIARHTSPQP
ncbi:transposable element Tcb2 transposase [Trichonephila clavipes]|nr:transposable element Tcb2 transposase [Trichonephila clavipes]